MEYSLQIDSPRPYFAEIPYYLWGEINYDSEGDCTRPTSRDWTWLCLTHRDDDIDIDITSDGPMWKVQGPDLVAARAAHLLCVRCQSDCEQLSTDHVLEGWDHEKALERANQVATVFSCSKLGPFDSHLFWGSWKWIGGFATSFTWVGRYIMHSVLTDDPRGVNLCIEWLRDGPFHYDQKTALKYALRELTGETFESDEEWIRWYDGRFFRRGAKAKYPEPDIDKWYQELRK